MNSGNFVPLSRMPILDKESQPQSTTPFTVGKIEEGLAILVSPDLQLVELPLDCLPIQSSTGPLQVGSMLRLAISHDTAGEATRHRELSQWQEEIMQKFGKEPDEGMIGGCLEAGRIGHRELVVRWPGWNMMAVQNGWRADLRSLDCYIDGSIIHASTMKLLNTFHKTYLCRNKPG